MSERPIQRSTAVVGAAVMASRLLGLVREQAFAAFFGAGRELDAFIAAFRIPNLFRDLLAEGALSAAFVTTFAKKLEKEGLGEAWRLANLVVHALVLIVGMLVLAGIVAAPWIVGTMAPGFADVPGKHELAVLLTRILFPFLLFVALAAVAMGMLNSLDRFGVPASASSFFNLGSIVVGLGAAWWVAPEYMAAAWSDGPTAAQADGESVQRAIIAMAVGTLVGGVLQLLIQLPSLWKVSYRYRPVFSLKDPGLREILALMGPATIGAAAVQVNVLVNTNFASGLGDGAVTWLNVAFRFMQLPIGLFGVAVGVVALPAVSRSAARADFATFNRTVGTGLRLVVALCVPASVGLAVLAPEIIGLVYERGRFGPQDTVMAAHALAAYAVGLAGYANIKVLVPAHYALDDARTPALVSMVSILVNASGNWMVIHYWGLGHAGLALVTSLVALLNFAVLYRSIVRRIGALEGIGAFVWRVVAAAAGMALICIAVREGVSVWGPDANVGRRALVVAAAIPVGAGAYAGIAHLLGVREVGDLVRRVVGRTGGET